MNMREKMARVSTRQAAEYFGVPGVNLFVETNWEDFAPDDILDVMREPSKDVRESGSLKFKGIGEWTIDMAPGWRAMIDAIKIGL